MKRVADSSVLLIFFPLFLLLPSFCSKDKNDLLTLSIKGYKLKVEVAESPEERELGLKFRKSLGRNRGMLFVFEEESDRLFWMKDTFIALSIGFISKDGTIINIEEMEPFDSMKRYYSEGKCKYALEVNKGWFKKRGIKPGDRVEGIP